MGTQMIGAGSGRRIVIGSLLAGGAVAVGALNPSAAGAATRPQPGSVVGFGDSVPAGSHCSCADFVAQYAAGIGSQVHNYARSGSTSADVVRLLHRSAVRGAVRRAGTVLIMTGANDYAPAFDSGGGRGRYRRVARTVQRNVSAAIEQVHVINPDAQVIVLDYWAAMEDGRVAEQDYTRAQRRSALAATESLDHALRAAAQAGHARFLSTYLAFHRAAGDVSALLADDGDHPDAAGTRIITRALDSLLVG